MEAIGVLILLVFFGTATFVGWAFYRGMMKTGRALGSSAKELQTRIGGSIQCGHCGAQYPSLLSFPCERCGVVATRNVASRCGGCDYKSRMARCPGCGKSIVYA